MNFCAILSFPVDSLLPDAEELHMAALELSLKALGDNNVQTAKHYGNLGRLYQSMKKYKVLILFLLSALFYYIFL